jgi:ribosomal protein S13
MDKEELQKVNNFFNKKVKDLTDDEKKVITDIMRTYTLENDLKREVS